MKSNHTNKFGSLGVPTLWVLAHLLIHELDMAGSTSTVSSLLRLSSRLVEGLVKQRGKYSVEEAGSC
jgi:hypothetical protein